MERETLLKRAIKPYMEIDFKHHRLEYPVTCLLVGINYDTEIMILQPIPENENPFEQDDFPAHISQCEFAKFRLKAVK